MVSTGRDPVRTVLAVVLTIVLVANLVFYLTNFGEFGSASWLPGLFWVGLANALFSAGLGIYVVAWRLRPSGTPRDSEPYSGD